MEKESLTSEEALEKMKESVPIKRYAKIHYSLAARINYEQMAERLAEGYTFTAIFEQLSKYGHLPANGDPNSLRKAFRREQERRGGKAASKIERDGTQEKTSKPPESHTKGTLPVEKVECEKSVLPEQSEKPEEKDGVETGDALKRLKLGTTRETVYGRITKYSDGTFDFD